MRKLIINLMAFVALLSCDSSETEEVSDVTNYAVIDYQNLVVIPLGGEFTPNATAKEGETTIPVKISGTVDTNAVGIYNITYAATNSDGFDASVLQRVVVHDPTIEGTDVSGDIQDKGRPERTGVISLVEGTNSIFFASDFGFGGTFPVYFQMDGDAISDIPQQYELGATSVELTYDPLTKEFTVLIHPQEFSYNFEYTN